MYIRSFAFSVLFAALGISVGSAQTTAPQSQTFDFTNKPTPQGLQEIATVLRTVGDIRQLSVDSAAPSVTVQGTPDELAMAGWIVHGLDQPLDSQITAPSAPFLVAAKSDDLIRIFHLGNIPKTPQAIQEILTVLRTVADTQRIFNYTALQDLVVRGPAAQMAFNEYIINSLNVSKDSLIPRPEFHYQAPRELFTVARVFYLEHASTPQAMQEILTTLRTVVGIMKVFNFTPLNALTICATADDLAASEFVIQSLDVAAAPKTGQTPNVREFQMPVDGKDAASVIHVFYLTHPATPKQVQEMQTVLRNVLGLPKVFNNSNPAALIFRGSADQIAKADQLLQDADKTVQTANAR